MFLTVKGIGDIDLFYFFEQFKLGKIVSVRIMTDKENGRSKGFGIYSLYLTFFRFRLI